MTAITPHASRTRRLLHDIVTGHLTPHFTGAPARPTLVTAPPSHHSTSQIAKRVLVQTAAVAVAMAAYFGVRGLSEGNSGSASRHAGWIVSAERFLHLHQEPWSQHLVVGHPAVTRVLNWIYIFGHWPVIVATLIWLLLRHDEVYRRARNAMLLSGAVGLVIFALLPVAPPRLAEPDLVDTVTRQSHAYRVLQPTAFTDQYAAMPSLHVGWNLLMTLAVLSATRRLWIRVSAIALSMSMDATVVLTANHYILDGVVGAGLAGLSWFVAGRWAERRHPAEPVVRSGWRPTVVQGAVAPVRHGLGHALRPTSRARLDR
jgi:membrane-associated phospholipid phosphatase